MKLFTEEDYRALILGYVEGAGARGADEEEIRDWLRWCEEIAVVHAMIELVARGAVLPFWDETTGEYLFSRKGSIN